MPYAIWQMGTAEPLTAEEPADFAKLGDYGEPNMDTVSTSIVERANLDVRTRLRRLTRLTNDHSKKAENHAHAFSLYAMVHNCCRSHGALSERVSGPRP